MPPYVQVGGVHTLVDVDAAKDVHVGGLYALADVDAEKDVQVGGLYALVDVDLDEKMQVGGLYALVDGGWPLNTATMRVGGIISIVRSQQSPDAWVGGVVSVIRSVQRPDVWVGGLMQVTRGRWEDRLVRAAIGSHFGTRYPQAIAGGAADDSDGDRATGVLSGSFGAQLSKPVAVGVQQWQ